MNRRGSINWQDGMLIEASHFTTETEFLCGLIGQAISARFGWFGLYAEPGDPPPLDIDIRLSGLSCHAELRRFRGFLPDGTWLDYEPIGPETVTAQIRLDTDKDQNLPIYLLAHENKFQTFGDPDPAEDPPREPFRRPRIELAIGSDPQWVRQRSLRLGGISIRNGTASLDLDTIPPSVTMSAWPALRELAFRTVEVFETWRLIGIRNYNDLESQLTDAKDEAERRLMLAKRDIAAMLALEAARAGSLCRITRSSGTPTDWFKPVTALAAVLQTVINLKGGLIDGLRDHTIRSRAEAALAAVIEFVPRPESLTEGAARVSDFIASTDLLLREILDAEPEDIIYRDKTYTPVKYSGRAYRREADRQILTINGLQELSVDHYIVILRGSPGRVFRSSPPNVRSGVNERNAFPIAEPTTVDLDYRDNCVLLSPRGFKSELKMDTLTLICLGGADLSSFETASTNDIQVCVHRKSAS